MFVSIVVGFLFVIILISLIILFLEVRSAETASARWSEAARQGRNQKLVMQKGMLFIGAFWIVFFPSILCYFPLTNFGEIHLFLTALVLPGQGILNALIHSDILKQISACTRRYLFCCCWKKQGGSTTTHHQQDNYDGFNARFSANELFSNSSLPRQSFRVDSAEDGNIIIASNVSTTVAVEDDTIVTAPNLE